MRLCVKCFAPELLMGVLKEVPLTTSPARQPVPHPKFALSVRIISPLGERFILRAHCAVCFYVRPSSPGSTSPRAAASTTGLWQQTPCQWIRRTVPQCACPPPVAFGLQLDLTSGVAQQPSRGSLCSLIRVDCS